MESFLPNRSGSVPSLPRTCSLKKEGKEPLLTTSPAAFVPALAWLQSGKQGKQENSKLTRNGFRAFRPCLFPWPHPRIERKWELTKGRKSCNNLFSIQKKFIHSGNAAGLDRIAHPIEGRRGRLPVAKQAPPRQFPTDSGKDIDTAQISKAFEGRLTPNGDLSPPLSPECFHTLGWESLPLDQQQLFVLPLFQLIRVSYISFLMSSLPLLDQNSSHSL